MQTRIVAAAAPQTGTLTFLRTVSLTILVLILLTWASSADATLPCSTPATTPEESGDVQIDEADNAEDSDAETVTVSIPLEDDGVIDVEAPPMGVKIERWDGDEVLVIVEKKKRSSALTKAPPVEPINIQVTRSGKNVRIETSGGADWHESGMDLSFRIVLPESYDAEKPHPEETDGLARVTGVLWKAVHRGALRWITR